MNIFKSEAKTKDTNGLMSKESSLSVLSNNNKSEKYDHIDNVIRKVDLQTSNKRKSNIKYNQNIVNNNDDNNDIDSYKKHSHRPMKGEDNDDDDHKRDHLSNAIEDVKWYYEEKLSKMKVDANYQALYYDKQLSECKSSYLQKETALNEEIEQMKADMVKKQSQYLDQILKINADATTEKKNKLEIIQQLRSDLTVKDKALLNLVNINTTLKKKVLQLTKEIESLTEQLNQMNKASKHTKKLKPSSEPLSIISDNQSKEKEQKISQISIEQKIQNSQCLKVSFDTFGDYTKKIDEADEKIKIKDNEIERLLKENQIQSNNHTLIKESNEKLIKEINVLKLESEISKEAINNLTMKNKSLEDQLIYLKYSVKGQQQQQTPFTLNIHKKRGIFNNANISNQNIRLKNQECLTNKIDNLSIMNELPTISNNMTNTNLSLKNYVVLFTKEERDALEKLFEDKSVFDSFIKKINQIELYKYSNESKLKSQINQLQSQTIEHHKKIESIEKELKEKEHQIKKDVLLISDLQIQKRGMIKKNVEYQVRIEDLNNKINVNDYEIQVLNSRRKSNGRSCGPQLKHVLSMELINKDKNCSVNHHFIKETNKTPMKLRTRRNDINYIEIEQK